CAWGTAGDTVGSSDCHYESGSSDDAQVLADKLNYDCGLGVNPVPDGDGGDGCTPDFNYATLGTATCASCGSESARTVAARKSRPPGTTDTLSLDPAHSFLAVSTPIQTVTVRLSGDAFVDLRGGRLLGLQISAEQARMANSDWNGFSFSLD